MIEPVSIFSYSKKKIKSVRDFVGVFEIEMFEIQQAWREIDGVYYAVRYTRVIAVNRNVFVVIGHIRQC
jgi:hypothetical protein